MIGFWWIVSIAVLAVEIALLLYILILYSKMHRSTGGRLLIGIQLFALLFIAQDALGTWTILSFYRSMGDSVSLPLAILNTLGLAALLSLYFTLRT